MSAVCIFREERKDGAEEEGARRVGKLLEI
jgi:hypothetical protein